MLPNPEELRQEILFELGEFKNEKQIEDLIFKRDYGKNSILRFKFFYFCANPFINTIKM
jgi:hypothetical protein